MNPLLISFIALSLLVMISHTSQAQPIDSIQISSSWTGLGTPSYEGIQITRKSDRFYKESEEIPRKFVLALWSAINEPIVPKPTLANLGITQEWLNENAEKGLQEYAENFFDKLALNQQELYRASLKDPNFIATILPIIYNSRHTDDYPFVKAIIHLSNGSRITISSEEQPLFMLPWKVKKGNQTVKTYNTHIARAIAAFLPEDERLVGKRLAYELADTTYHVLEEKLKYLEVENRFPSYLAKLKEHYKIISIEANPYYNIDYGKEWVNGISAQENLHVMLRRPDFPKNFFIGLVLPIIGDKVENLGLFSQRIEAYKKQIFAVPWLKQYILSNPKTPIVLRFVTNRSFSEQAMKSFGQEMSLIGKSGLAVEVSKFQDEISLLLVGRGYIEAYWLVLPDKRLILWRYGDHFSLLKWKPKNFDNQACKNSNEKCVGAIISPTGKIISQ